MGFVDVMILLRIVSRRKALVRLVSIHIDLLVFIIFVGSGLCTYTYHRLVAGRWPHDSTLCSHLSILPAHLISPYFRSSLVVSVRYHVVSHKVIDRPLPCADQQKSGLLTHSF